jgi:hypothetical protein
MISVVIRSDYHYDTVNLKVLQAWYYSNRKRVSEEKSLAKQNSKLPTTAHTFSWAQW